MPRPLLSATELLASHGASNILICDCSYSLADPEAGRAAWAAGHIPGAVHLDLHHDMAGAKTGFNGRHPLPDPQRLAARLGGLGADGDTLIVAYDGMGGMYAARLWWLLRWLGHAHAVVLDGGLSVWKAAGGPLETAEPARRPARTFPVRASRVGVADLDEVRRLDADSVVVDARSADRFRGENETIDPVPGHIPGARNRPFGQNLTDGGRFKSPERLRQEWSEFLANAPPNATIHQCGSGVTACVNLLALEVAGLPGGRLYPGSWSEWCAQPGAVVAIGPA